ncbi:MAG: 6-carboxytetrahydropterin synthase [Acidobacteriaceae bacterium]
MKAYLSRRYTISASHRLHSDAYTAEENRAVYGKCSHPHGHGHNYVVEVTVSGQVDPVTGMVCDLAELDGFMQQAVVARFDHQNLNCNPAFAQVVPTTENFCLEVHRIIKRGFSSAVLERVRVEETSKNYFEYSETGARTF